MWIKSSVFYYEEFEFRTLCAAAAALECLCTREKQVDEEENK